MDNIFSIILGIVCIAIGISNRKGNISLLHSYHRKRVSEEDRLPFGKLIGLGTIIIGIALMLMGGLTYAATYLEQSILSTVANVVFVIGLVMGAGITFYAMFKYNKGIF